MKKIAIFDYDMSVIGGVEKVSCQLANSLIDYYEVFIISTTNMNGQMPYKLNSKIKYINILENENYKLRTMVVKTRKKFRNIIKENKIDVVLSMGTYNGLIAAVNRIGLKTKIIFCDHGALINQWNEKSTTLVRLISSILSDKIVVLTEKSMNDYIERFKTPKKKISYIYNWIDEDIFKYVELYNCTSNKIVSVGRLSSEKGFSMLVETAKELKKLNDNWQWDIYGCGPEMEKISKQIDESNLEHYVNLKGNQNFMYDKYKEYSIFALTSYREGLPLVLLEAKANRLPVVSFDIETGPKEIIENNVNGFLIKKYDTKEMALKINMLLNNRELLKQFSLNSYNNINKFEKESILSQWKNLIDNI